MRPWRPSKKTLVPLLILLGGLLLTVTLIATGKQHQSQPYKKILPIVEVVAVQPRREQLVVHSEGVLEARHPLDLAPEVDGRITWVSPELVAGGRFQEGEPLLRIDPAEYQSAVAQAEARLQKATVEQQYTSDELTRMRQLHSKKLASDTALEQAQRLAVTASAELTLSQALLDDAKRDLTRTSLLAPFDGRVLSEALAENQFVRRGETLAALYQTSVLEVRLPIPQQQLKFLNLPSSDSPALVQFHALYAGITHQFSGRLVRLEAELDRRSNMVYGVAQVLYESLPAELPIGLFVEADIMGREVDNVIRLHRSAMRNSEQVVVVDAEHRLRLPEVSILRLEGDYVLIQGGLTAGTLVSTHAVELAVEGMVVEPVLVSEQLAPAAAPISAESVGGLL
ncbi:efflux RND transporter periplasmic adaptor subunit [Halioxenophilus sp. WMMB6]|uniref:efflux RND transporter periplasmic adaptor subunit n=1 Tax=Halioxenophilus sp. WMMB6 TaxID=3073815 RepID=UPI00295E4D10|nr:efflux RND transporter periplasmic adaptor subunit [Halioxenophilus sp. WMMB6]